MSATSPSPRQQRSQQTRHRLLEATVDELADRGYAELRTAAVASRGGVSQGSVFAHFGNKVRLVAAAATHYFERELNADAVAIDLDAPLEDRVWRLLEVMWAEMRSDAYLGVLEVYSAARTNAALREAMAPVVLAEIQRAENAGHLVLSHLAGLGTNEAARGRFDALVATLIYTLQAAAREAATLGRPDPREPVLRQLQAQIVRELRAP
ncbi:MAG: helix-turn-helix domain-containing protein [Myxococcota bacterium]